jgi:hypothetical protein
LDEPSSVERLILHYAPLVKYVAGRVSVGLPPNIEQADLVSYGTFGLIDAIEKYDLERGIKSETYAISRIKGAEDPVAVFESQEMKGILAGAPSTGSVSAGRS